jgi:hypothetical protein
MKPHLKIAFVVLLGQLALAGCGGVAAGVATGVVAAGVVAAAAVPAAVQPTPKCRRRFFCFRRGGR